MRKRLGEFAGVAGVRVNLGLWQGSNQRALVSTGIKLQRRGTPYHPASGYRGYRFYFQVAPYHPRFWRHQSTTQHPRVWTGNPLVYARALTTYHRGRVSHTCERGNQRTDNWRQATSAWMLEPEVRYCFSTGRKRAIKPLTHHSPEPTARH